MQRHHKYDIMCSLDCRHVRSSMTTNNLLCFKIVYNKKKEQLLVKWKIYFMSDFTIDIFHSTREIKDLFLSKTFVLFV